jgi:hypothetical protein
VKFISFLSSSVLKLALYAELVPQLIGDRSLADKTEEEDWRGFLDYQRICCT